MKIKIKILVAYCALFCLVSCEKIIDTEVPYNQIGTAEVFSDVTSANAALSGLYAELWSSSMFSGDISGSSAILGTYTDDLNCYANYIQNGLVDLYNNVHISSNTIIYNLWSRSYKHIYYANAIIKGVEASETLSAEHKDRLIGEALAIRSLLYYHLQQIFEEIPYTSVTDYGHNTQLRKHSKRELLVQLRDDLKRAIPMLKDQYNNQERIFVNRKVAEMLLAKVYMQENDWSAAEQLLQEIIQSPLYAFETDLSKVFLKTGRHILWQLKPANATDATKEYLLFNFTVSLPTSFSLSDVLVNSFETGDLRKQSWILPTVVNQKTYYRPLKYKNPANSNPNEYSVVFRLEEIYLLYAEVLGHQGQGRVEEAKIWLDKIRNRAGLDPLPFGMAPVQLFQSIEREWRHEYFAEMGHRFLTLKRLDRLEDVSLSKPNWKTFHRSFPIPEREISINPNLNPQNTGY